MARKVFQKRSFERCAGGWKGKVARRYFPWELAAGCRFAFLHNARDSFDNALAFQFREFVGERREYLEAGLNRLVLKRKRAKADNDLNSESDLLICTAILRLQAPSRWTLRPRACVFFLSLHLVIFLLFEMQD